MKKYLSFTLVIFLLILSVLISGCDDSGSGSNHSALPISNEDNYVDDQDYQYMFSNEINETYAAKGSKGYYAYMNNYIYYIDPTTLDVAPLCNKADCLHDKETDNAKKSECRANISLGISKQLYYSLGNLYVMQESQKTGDDGTPITINNLIKISEDGNSRETVVTIENQNLYNWIIHRNCLYYVTYPDDADYSNSETEDSEIEKSALWKIPLDNTDKKTPLLTLDDSGLFGADFGYLTAYGNHLFLNVCGYTDEDDYNRMLDETADISDISVNSIYINYNIEDDKMSLIKGRDGEYIVFEGFSDNKFLFYSIYNGNKSDLTSVNINGGDFEIEHNYTEAHQRYRVDKKYYYSENYFSDEVNRGEAPETYTVYDKEWNKIMQITLPYTSNMAVGDDNYIFDIVYSNTNTSLYCIDKSEFTSGSTEPKLLYQVSAS